MAPCLSSLNIPPIWACGCWQRTSTPSSRRLPRPCLRRLSEDLSRVLPSQKVEIELAGDDREFLLFDWLKELLYRFDAEHMLFSRFEVQVRPDGLERNRLGRTAGPRRGTSWITK